jgi:hypothetical protein
MVDTEQNDESTPLMLPQREYLPPSRRGNEANLKRWAKTSARLLPLLLLDAPITILLILISQRELHESQNKCPDGLVVFCVRNTASFSLTFKLADTFIQVLFSVLVNLGQLTPEFRGRNAWISPISHLLATISMFLASFDLTFTELVSIGTPPEISDKTLSVWAVQLGLLDA